VRSDTHVRPERSTPKPAPLALKLVESARQKLAAGKRDTSAVDRYVAAYMAALRAAAAVIAAKPKQGDLGRRRRPQNIWELLPRAEPALGRWAAHFSAVAAARGPVRFGRIWPVSRRQADMLFGDAEAFVSLAEDALSVVAQPARPDTQHHPDEPAQVMHPNEPDSHASGAEC
jgi:hypothetical protein